MLSFSLRSLVYWSRSLYQTLVHAGNMPFQKQNNAKLSGVLIGRRAKSVIEQGMALFEMFELT